MREKISLSLIKPARDKSTKVGLQNQGIFDSELSEIVSLVNQYPNITSLNLYQNNIGNPGAKLLAD